MVYLLFDQTCSPSCFHPARQAARVDVEQEGFRGWRLPIFEDYLPNPLNDGSQILVPTQSCPLNHQVDLNIGKYCNR